MRPWGNPYSFCYLQCSSAGSSEASGEPGRYQRLQIRPASDRRIEAIQLRAASSSSDAASLPCLEANAIWARSKPRRARSKSLRTPAPAVTEKPRASSSAPAWNFVCAAARARSARRVGSGVERPRARGRPRPRRSRPVPGLVRRSARVRWRPPHPVRMPPQQDARRDDRGRPPRRSPPPTPGAPAVGAPPLLPPGRSPSARADDETAPSLPISISPADSAGSSAVPAIPSRSPARHKARGRRAAPPPRPPTFSGSLRERLQPLHIALLDPPDSDSAPGSANPPASCAADSPRGSSNRASGFPRVSATAPYTPSPNGPGMTDTKSDRASAARSPSTTSSGNRATSHSGSRVANTITTHSASSRRATNARPGRMPIQPLRVIDHAKSGLPSAASERDSTPRDQRESDPAPGPREART